MNPTTTTTRPTVKNLFTTTLNWRVFALLAITCAALLLLVCEPTDTLADAAWLATLIATKGGALLLLAAAWRLHDRWERDGSLRGITEAFKDL